MKLELPFLNTLTARLNDSSSRKMVAIIGPPASGKTTVAGQLVEALAHPSVISLSMDGYHHRNAYLLERGLYPWKGCHFTFASDQFVNDMKKIKEDASEVLLPSYDRTVHHDPIPDQICVRPEHRTIIVEGNYLLLDVAPWNELRPIWDFTIFIDVDEKTQIDRLIKRHTLGGRTKEEAFEKVYSTDIPNAHLIRESRENVDYIFDS